MIALDRRGMIVYAHIDHAKEAAAVNIAIRPTHLFVVGYREADSPLLAQNQLLGIELPLRILVWEDAGGAVLLTYTDPAWLGGRYGMKEISSQLAAMGVSLAGIAEEAKKL